MDQNQSVCGRPSVGGGEMSEDMAGSAAGTPRATTVIHSLLSERGFPADPTMGSHIHGLPMGLVGGKVYEVTPAVTRASELCADAIGGEFVVVAMRDADEPLLPKDGKSKVLKMPVPVN